MKKRITVVLLLLFLLAMISCDKKADDNSDGEGMVPAESPEAMIDSEEKTEKTQLEEMAGRWIIDFDRTDMTLWGSGISFGNEMEISQTGEFSYYIGIGVGGTGQCEDENGKITVEIQPYEEHSSEREILLLKYENENQAEHILMNWHDEDVYWIRENTEAADDFSAASDTQEIKEMAEKFAAAYFSGDVEAVQDCLINPYKWDIEVYTGTGIINNVTIKDLETETDREDIGSTKVILVEYKSSDKEDTYQYLTLEFVKQEDGWKIQFYGIEQ